MNEYKLLINGSLVDGDSTMEVLNPATEEPVATCARASEDQLNEAVAAARSAFPAWSAQSIDKRKAIVSEMADAIEANGQELAQLLVQEQGKPLEAAMGEVLGTAAFFRYFTSLDLPVKVIEDSENRRVEAHHTPLGVIGAIVPWNVPLALMAFKVPPALIAGNTVVLKPAPTTPLTTLRFAALVSDIVPAGVLNVITDQNDLGGPLTTHPDVRKISFTGSTATGAKVMAGAAGLLKRVTLELGGNDAAIVLDDVDPKEVAPQLFQSAFMNSGQICIAMKRLYVHDNIYDEMCGEMAAIAESTPVGNGLEQGTQLGPLQNKMQYERVKELINEAREEGTIIAGGEIPDEKGYFIKPTIVRDIKEGSRLVDEEQFGPVLPIMRFTSEEEAIERANATDLGLGGSVWSADLDKAYAVAQHMDAGTIWINQHAALDPSIPFGGSGQSGIGTELGEEEGLAEYTQMKIVNMAK